MAWTILLLREFQVEFGAMPEEARDALIATMRILREFGPNARRAAFAFDPKQQGIVLVCGDKAGEVQSDF